MNYFDKNVLRAPKTLDELVDEVDIVDDVEMTPLEAGSDLRLIGEWP